MVHTLKAGMPAPDFTLQDAHGHPITMHKMRGTRVVLYFYPEDDTTGCTLEGKEFTEIYHEFAKHGILVFGISRDSTKSHEQFAEKHCLKVPLLSDPDGKVCEAYGVLANSEVVRTTFSIDKTGKIDRVWERVEPKGHAHKVLLDLTSS